MKKRKGKLSLTQWINPSPVPRTSVADLNSLYSFWWIRIRTIHVFEDQIFKILKNTGTKKFQPKKCIILRDLTVSSHLYPNLESQEWHIPAGNWTRASRVGSEHSRKEPSRQLVNSYSEQLHISPRHHIIYSCPSTKDFQATEEDSSPSKKEHITFKP